MEMFLDLLLFDHASILFIVGNEVISLHIKFHFPAK